MLFFQTSLHHVAQLLLLLLLFDRRRAIPFTVVIVSTMVSGVFAAPLAAGLMSLDGTGGLSGWQWLFLIEGEESSTAYGTDVISVTNMICNSCHLVA